MRKIALSVMVLGTMLAPMLMAAPAQAQATRTWVSGVGDDVNPCSRTAPCKTFAGAISKTAINGEINCIDPGGFGALTITKSITLDCIHVWGSILASNVSGITVNLTTTTTADPLQTVRIRGITINGAGSCGAGCGTRTGLNGINIIKATAVFVENVVIDGFTQQGIRDARTAGGRLVVQDTTIRGAAGAGVQVIATGTGTSVTLENVNSNANGFGVAVGSPNKMMVNRSAFTGNVSAGVEADAGAQLTVDDSVISNNVGNGVQAAGTVRLSNNDIAFNGTGITGATLSFGNNRIAGNTAVGTAPTAIGAASSDRGQQ